MLKRLSNIRRDAATPRTRKAKESMKTTEDSEKYPKADDVKHIDITTPTKKRTQSVITENLLALLAERLVTAEHKSASRRTTTTTFYFGAWRQTQFHKKAYSRDTAKYHKADMAKSPLHFKGSYSGSIWLGTVTEVRKRLGCFVVQVYLIQSVSLDILLNSVNLLQGD